MAPNWPSISYGDSPAACETLHALTQFLGKLAVALAPPEPQLQHAALRLTARGWETMPLPAPDGSGSFVVILDLLRHELFVEHSRGMSGTVPLQSHSVGDVVKPALDIINKVAGKVEIATNPQEVSWTVPLDQDDEHRHYDPRWVNDYFIAATQAALALAEFRAPFRGRSTPVNAWWGSFDLAVNLFSGEPAAPPSPDFIMRNAMDVQEVAIGWWPGSEQHPGAAFYGYAHPAQPGFAEASLAPAAGSWSSDLGEYVLEMEDLQNAKDPHALAVEFANAVFQHACSTCGWDPLLAASAEGNPPPIN